MLRALINNQGFTKTIDRAFFRSSKRIISTSFRDLSNVKNDSSSLHDHHAGSDVHDFITVRHEDPADDHGHELVSHTRIRGIDILRDPKMNKGLAFSLRERQLMGFHGLLPPAELTQAQQLRRIRENFDRQEQDLMKYIFLVNLRERNEKLFFRFVIQNINEMLPLIYTPTVGLACRKYGIIYRKPRGLFITIHDMGHIYEIMCNWPEHDIRAIVVSDGERILGLGDLGVYGMGIPVGKLTLYTALAGIKPQHCLPIILDVGTNNETLLNDEFYLGIKQKRVTGKQYDAFIDEFMETVVKIYGQNTLIQFEDFGNRNAFRFLEKYRNKYTFFNDDIQGTASVAVAGVLASLRITNTELADNVFLFQGAGEASIGIAKLLCMAMEKQGIPREEAIKKIWLVDSRGLIVKNRPKGGVIGEKVLFAKEHPPVDTLGEAVKVIKPTTIIGAAGIPRVFTEELIRDMASFNDHPVIFALSNPTSKAECTAEEAYRFTDGRAVFATGSPFDPVTINGKTFYPGQGNNAYIFPGVALGTIACDMRHIPDEVFLLASKTLAKLVTQEHLDQGQIYPPMTEIRKISLNIATTIAEWAYKKNMAAHYPEPEDKYTFIKSQTYSTKYESFIPDVYDWPGDEEMMF